MESVKVENLTFTYPNEDSPVLKNISFSVKNGEFITVFGKSGCGKSTLLRHLKPNLMPSGKRCGKIFIGNLETSDLTHREQAEKIGFVMQDPDSQIVTDKVWHELSFGLENLGIARDEIRARVAEVSAFFGISDLFYKKTEILSGGQKQLLNLAAIMAMHPSVLILDEPTSCLDPVAAHEFLQNVSNLNKETGTTIILTEHRLNEAFALSDRVFAMEDGKIISAGTPSAVCKELYEIKSDLTVCLPCAPRIFAAAENSGTFPVTVRDGRKWLSQKTLFKCRADEEKTAATGETVLCIKDLWFRYEKGLPDVLKGVTVNISKGEHYAILGANGAGKSTLLSVIANIFKAYRGSIKVFENRKISYLPQNPKLLFTKKTVYDDLDEMLSKNDTERDKKLKTVIGLCMLSSLLNRHPYDLSGGEQQRAALAKVLLTKPDILLLDEPTKGIDEHFKEEFAKILKSLQNSGVTVITVSHDIEFCAKYATRCAMFFDGTIVSESSPESFFAGKNFYTTAAARISRGIIENAVSEDDILCALGVERISDARKISDDENFSQNEAAKINTESILPKKSGKTHKKRKISAKRIVFGSLFAVLCALQLMFPLSKMPIFVKKFGSLGGSMSQLVNIITLAISLFCFIPQKRGERNAVQKKAKISKRSVFTAVFTLSAMLATALFGVYFLGDRKYYFISLALIFETLIPFFAAFEKRKPKAREIVIISVLCALAVSGRVAFFMLPQFKPIVAVVMISASVFGGETGFLIGAVSAFVSNFFFSQGPWTPWQMFALASVGLITGMVYQKNLLPKTKLSLSVFGFFATLIIYGGIMNPASVIMYQPYPDANLIISAYWLGLPFDLVHAASTAFFMWFISEPLTEKIERVKIKYNLDEK